jgi:hypothetical protein
MRSRFEAELRPRRGRGEVEDEADVRAKRGQGEAEKCGSRARERRGGGKAFARTRRRRGLDQCEGDSRPRLERDKA